MQGNRCVLSSDKKNLVLKTRKNCALEQSFTTCCPGAALATHDTQRPIKNSSIFR